MLTGRRLPFKAIAAMSLNRVIGVDNKIPWHLPEDFKWFKRMTTGQVIVMGRKTFESIGKALPNRTTIVLSRTKQDVPDVQVVTDLDALQLALLQVANKDIFICGGAELYRQTLPLCSNLFLTLVKREVEGDTFFPQFEDRFILAEILFENNEMKICRYENASLNAKAA